MLNTIDPNPYSYGLPSIVRPLNYQIIMLDLQNVTIACKLS